jgi:hypothetical protein
VAVHVDDILARRNVVGCGVGRRTVGGQRTDEWAVVVFVSSKLQRESLRASELVPSELQGDGEPVRTDVVETAPQHLLADTAHNHQQPRPPWLRPVAAELRVHATVGADLHLALDQLSTSPAPASACRQQFLELLTDVLNEAATRLRRLKTITAAEAATWQTTPGQTVIWRGATERPTQPIAELAGAMTALIDGTLPRPPEHTWWLYGHPGGRQTVPMQPGSDEKG